MSDGGTLSGGPPAAPECRVLLIEDDEKLARLTARYLEKNGLACDLAHDGLAGLAAAERGEYDAILLDLMLPGLDGLELCRKLRATRDTPILMLTARGEEVDRVVGLEMGADDYLPKPFSSRELLARIRAHVRRARGAFPSAARQRARPLVVGALRLDRERRRATLSGRELLLSVNEFSLLFALAERAGEPIGRERLLERASVSPEESFDRAIDVAISRLRQKLGDDPKSPELIITVRGIGYMLARPEEP